MYVVISVKDLKLLIGSVADIMEILRKSLFHTKCCYSLNVSDVTLVYSTLFFSSLVY